MYSVLIAEDEILVRLGLTISVPWKEMDMYVVAEASDGKSALELWRRHRPDILITDLNMPEMDGLSLIRAIRAEDDHAAIVVVTCLERFDLLHQAMELGVSAYLVKASMSLEDISNAVRCARDALDAPRIPASKQSHGDKEALLAQWLKGIPPDTSALSAEYHKRGWQLPCRVRAVAALVCEEARLPYAQAYLLKRLLMDALKPFGPLTLPAGERDGTLSYLLEASSDGLPAALENYLSYTTAHFGARLRIVYSRQELPLKRLPAWLNKALPQLGRWRFGEWSVFAADDDGRPILPSIEREMRELRTRLWFIGGWAAGLKAHGALRRLEMALYEDAIACNEAATNFARLFTEAVPPPVEAGLEPLLKWLGTALPACSRAPRSEVVRVIEHLADHIAEPLSLTRAAEIAHMHPQYLSNLFKYETGVGYADFVCLMRIEHAQRLLSETDMNLREISEASGFSDVAYFCRKFKQKTALTAGQWRKRAK